MISAPTLRHPPDAPYSSEYSPSESSGTALSHARVASSATRFSFVVVFGEFETVAPPAVGTDDKPTFANSPVLGPAPPTYSSIVSSSQFSTYSSVAAAASSRAALESELANSFEPSNMGPRVPVTEAEKETDASSDVPRKFLACRAEDEDVATSASSAFARAFSLAVRLPALTAFVTCSCSASVMASESRIVLNISALSALGAPEDQAILLAAKYAFKRRSPPSSASSASSSASARSAPRVSISGNAFFAYAISRRIFSAFRVSNASRTRPMARQRSRTVSASCAASASCQGQADVCARETARSSAGTAVL
mmetsp:Transcript_14475/g.60984  ORF Transcript_14475/g.60984 Transcript_14475/m.60984 type:complete len:311 (+) Transcript_14475:1845-2777(+)